MSADGLLHTGNASKGKCIMLINCTETSTVRLGLLQQHYPIQIKERKEKKQGICQLVWENFFPLVKRPQLHSQDYFFSFPLSSLFSLFSQSNRKQSERAGFPPTKAVWPVAGAFAGELESAQVLALPTGFLPVLKSLCALIPPVEHNNDFFVHLISCNFFQCKSCLLCAS